MRSPPLAAFAINCGKSKKSKYQIKSKIKSNVHFFSFFFAVVLCSPPDTGGLVLLLQCADVTLCFLDLSHCLVASLKAGVRLHFSSNSKMKMLYNLQWTLDCEK